MHATQSDLDARTAEIVKQYQSLEGPLLPILNALQAEFGYVPKSVLPDVAAALNISRAEIHGVVSFYHDYRDHPAGEHVIKVCRAEACQAAGGEAMSARLLSLLGIDWHGTTANGKVTVEPAYCLGLCACAPALFVDGAPIGRVSADRVDILVAEVAS
ncbi:formate dehydrogenase subunit gamma [Rubricella aquisinus]|uniref:Formate dehydrogenase subunit gamma n=1 Tax=Rubricella aquisinus TaxID=2028108 RepID=A0A840WLD8_9RHOB|nr:formate dehydrogenase subunit gamma [Rubricella aquisinus]MBB5515869.1 formate dehydrogenase subunit gamma [Rubricella aquisinus]